MSKEFDLTTQAQKPYPENGDKYMPEPGNGEVKPSRVPQEVKSSSVPKQEGHETAPTVEPNVESLVRELRGFPEDVLRKAAEELAKKQRLPTEEAADILEQTKQESIEQGLGTEARLMASSETEVTDEQAAAEALYGSLHNPEFASIVSRIMNGADRRVLYEEFAREWGNIDKRLREQLAELGPENAENALQRRMLEAQIQQLTTEARRMNGFIIEPSVRQSRGMSEKAKNSMDAIKSMPEGADKTARIKELIEPYSPEDEPMPDEVLELIASSEIVAEEFVTRLTVSELEDEPWSIRGFYTSTNYEKFVRLSTEKVMPAVTKKRLLELINANREFHNMNYIIKRNFERFGESSESLLPQQFSVLARTAGVSEVIKMYEDAYQTYLAANTRIKDENVQQMDIDVANALKRVNELGIIKGVTGGSLEQWEMDRARIFGRNFFRVLVRAGEHAVLSELPEGGELFTSPVQKGFSQILNNIKWTGVRFRPNETLGGPEFMEGALEENAKKRDKLVGIRTLQGTDVDMRETQSMIGTRGVMATWRNSEAVLRQISFLENVNGEQRVTNVTKFFEDHANEIAALDSLKGGTKMIETEKLFKPLIENVSVGLGLIVSPSMIPVPNELKEILWKKSANLSPQVMASMLTRIELWDPKEIKINEGRIVKPFEDILIDAWGEPGQRSAIYGGQINSLKRKIEESGIALGRLKAIKNPTEAQKRQLVDLGKSIDDMRLEHAAKEKVLGEVLGGSNWIALKEKLEMAELARVRDEGQRIASGKLDTKPKELNDYLPELNKVELRVLEEIKNNSDVIAPDLARIRQSHAWFLNDTPFEIIDWNRLGQFYDRQTNDLGQFNKAQGALIGLISNPYGVGEEKVLEAFHGAIEGVAAVHGNESAQNRLEPFLISWMKNVEEHHGKFWRKAKVVTGFEHLVKKPTSRAQEYLGADGPAYDEESLYRFLEHSLKLGIVRKGVKNPKTGEEKFRGHDQLHHLEQEFKLDVFHRMFLAKVRDYGPIGIIAFFLALFKEISSSSGSRH